MQLPVKSLNKLVFALPPLPEQRKIAEIHSTVDEAIEKTDAIIEETRQLKKGLMQKLFTEGIGHTRFKDTKIGRIPEEWEVFSLQDIALFFQYGTSIKCSYERNGVPVLRIPNILGGRIDSSDLKYGPLSEKEIDSLRLNKGDLLFVRTNGVKSNAGRCAMFNGEVDHCYYASYLIRVRVDTSKLLPLFLDEYTRTDVGKSFLSGRAETTADGKFNINTGTLKEVLVPIPPLNEQKAINQVLITVNTKIENEEAYKAELEQLKKGLMQVLLTGIVRVKVNEEEKEAEA